MIEIKVVRNVILNKIDLNDQPSRMHRSQPRSHQNFPDSKKNQRLQLFPMTPYIVLIEIKVVRNVILNKIDIYD